MLKACCDCIAAGIREEHEVYGAEITQLNGRSPRAPSWPETTSVKEIMFLLPTILKGGDEIIVTGIISPSPQWVKLSLITEMDRPNGQPDYNNIASQIILQFPSNDSNEDYIVLRTIVQGQTEEKHTNLTASDLIPDPEPNATYKVILTIKVVKKNMYEYDVAFNIGDSYVEKISLKHPLDVIRYIVFDGDVEKVEKLEFIFS